MGTVLNREEKQTIHIHNNKMFVKAALFTLLVCSSQAGWQQHLARQASKPAGNLVEELAANGASTLIDFAVKAGLADTLTGEGPFTVFAPTNAAFAALPQEIVDAVSADTELLKSVLLYHVVPGNILSSAASNDLTLDTAQGTSLRVNVYSKPHHYGNTITVNGKSVVKADIKASNGVIHFIDGVMLIPKGDLWTLWWQMTDSPLWWLLSLLLVWWTPSRTLRPSPSSPPPMTPSPRSLRPLSMVSWLTRRL